MKNGDTTKDCSMGEESINYESLVCKPFEGYFAPSTTMMCEANDLKMLY